jgi:phosphohistidine phosphatase SixA/dienelactone hydrolase
MLGGTIMKILLIRHATRTRRVHPNPGVLPEWDDPLSPVGEREALALAQTMEQSGDVPTLFLTSRQRHAHQTAEILWGRLNQTATLVPLNALSPHVQHPLVNRDMYVEAISHDMNVFAHARPDIKDGLRETVAIILHYPRNVQCALQLQGKKPDTWEDYWQPDAFGRAICLTADTWDDFLQGRGREIVGGTYDVLGLPMREQQANTSGRPLLVYLHGAGEKGKDTASQLCKHGPWLEVGFNPDTPKRDRADDPQNVPYDGQTLAEIERFNVIAFHLLTGSQDWDPQTIATVNQQINNYIRDNQGHIDGGRVCLTGISIGGRGVLRLAAHRLESGEPVSVVAAFCPEGGVKVYSQAEIARLRTASVPVRLFHCRADELVPFAGTEQLCQQTLNYPQCDLREVAVNELPAPYDGHVCWTRVYGCRELYRWLDDPTPGKTLPPNQWRFAWPP